MVERRRLDAGTLKKARNPALDREIELNSSGIDEQRDLPGRHGTQANDPVVLPAAIDQTTGRRTQAFVAAVEPEGDMRVEQQLVRHRSISRPVAASGSTSRAGATTSTCSRTRTDPGCAPNSEPDRAS